MLECVFVAIYHKCNSWFKSSSAIYSNVIFNFWSKLDRVLWPGQNIWALECVNELVPFTIYFSYFPWVMLPDQMLHQLLFSAKVLFIINTPSYHATTYYTFLVLKIRNTFFAHLS